MLRFKKYRLISSCDAIAAQGSTITFCLQSKNVATMPNQGGAHPELPGMFEPATTSTILHGDALCRSASSLHLENRRAQFYRRRMQSGRVMAVGLQGGSQVRKRAFHRHSKSLRTRCTTPAAVKPTLWRV